MVFQQLRMTSCFYCVQLLTFKQCCLHRDTYFAGLERYRISDSKTMVFIVNSPVDTGTWNQSHIFSIYGNPTEVVNEVHFGIKKRDSISRSSHSTTATRGCAYSLMGTSRQRSGKGATRKRFQLQKPRRVKTKLTIKCL